MEDFIDKKTGQIEDMNPDDVIEIIIHCSDTSASPTLGVEDIYRWHTKGNGWLDCGYHYVIKTDGEIQLGRPEYKVGAHCLGENRRSIGICYIGGRKPSGHPGDTRTYAQKISLAYLMGNLLHRFKNIRAIYGHNDFSVKVCPCFDAKSEYKDFISKYRNINS